MKRIVLILAVVFMTAIVFNSCKKQESVSPEKTYAKTIAGNISIQNGDVTLKSAPVGANQWLYMYKQVTPAPTFALVNGSEFLTGSAPAIFWSTSGNNPGTFPVGTSVYSNYTPAIPVRMVAKTVDGSSVPAYLGIWDGTPSVASFPVTIYGKRLGDVLTVNTDALTALPGYASMSFDVVYTKSIIDVSGTMVSSPATGPTTWPVYSYSSNPLVTATLDATKSLGARPVYDGLDAKITGTIVINIHVDGITISVNTPAADMGHGLAITLLTSKIGWYDSGTMTITQDDITVDATNLTVN